MKKFVKSILALTLVLAISFAFAGCKIVIIEGKWTATEMTVEQYIYADDTQEKTIVETKANMINAGAQFVVEIKEGGTGHASFLLPETEGFLGFEMEFDQDITWTEKDGKVVVDMGDGDTLELENNNTGKLVFQQTEENEDKTQKMVVKITFTRSK